MKNTEARIEKKKISFALDKQLLDLLKNQAQANERNISSELRYRLRQAYGLKEVMQAWQGKKITASVLPALKAAYH